MSCRQAALVEFVGGLATPSYSGSAVTYSLNTVYSNLITSRPDIRWYIAINIPDVCTTRAQCIVRSFLRQYNLLGLISGIVFTPSCEQILGSNAKDITLDDEMIAFINFYGDAPSS